MDQVVVACHVGWTWNEVMNSDFPKSRLDVLPERLGDVCDESILLLYNSPFVVNHEVCAVHEVLGAPHVPD